MPRSIPVSIPGYHLERSIGDGNAAVVYYARRSVHESNNVSAEEVAVKVIPRSKVRDSVKREVALHITLHHPNIVRLHRVVAAAPSSAANSSPRSSPRHRPLSSSSLQPTPTSLAIVMDYAAMGDMFSEVASAGSLPPRILRRRLKEIASALKYLHQNGIAHLDVKLENVVLTSNSTAKLIDFGCARYIKDRKDSSQYSSFGGTLQYLSPEVIETSRPVPSFASDAWALGVLTYTAIAGNYPFSASSADPDSMDDTNATRHRIVNCRPHRISSAVRVPSDIQNIMDGLLEKDPRKRWTVSKVLAELEKSSDDHYRTHRSTTTTPEAPRRPRSPAGTPEADFDSSSSPSKQSKEEALRIVESIQRNRARADREVQKYMSDIGMTSSHAKDTRASKGTRPRAHEG